MGCSCDRPVTVRPTCGGRRICLAPWLALVLVLLFMLVLFGRCRLASNADTNVSRETSVTGNEAVNEELFHVKQNSVFF